MTYEAWDTDTESKAAANEHYEPWGGSEEKPSSTGKRVAQAAAIAGGAGLSAWGAGRLAKWAFPQLGNIGRPRSSLNAIDEALKSDFGGLGLKHHFPEYTRMVRESGKPMTFADYLALKSERAPETTKLINKMLDESGKPNSIATNLGERSEGRKGRVMDALADELGIPKESLQESEEALKKKRSESAAPLYAEAFKDKSPIKDTNLLDLFSRGSMTDALKRAEEVARLRGTDISKRYAADPQRRDAWKRLLTSEVPGELFTGKEHAGLREYISPNAEELHHTREALWDLYSTKKKEGKTAEAGEYLKGWKDLTNMMDKVAPDAYRKARQSYKADSDVLNAHEMGSELFKQNPEDFRKQLLTMSPEEREGLARGFYGQLMEMNDPRFVREVVGNSPQYKKQKDLLSAIFPDTKTLHSFLNSLEGEQAMLAGEKAYRKPGSANTTSGLTENIRSIIGSGVDPKMSFITRMHAPPYDPFNSVSRKGAPVLFNEPSFFGRSAYHPSGADVFQHGKGFGRAYPGGDVVAPSVGGAGAGAWSWSQGKPSPLQQAQDYEDAPIYP